MIQQAIAKNEQANRFNLVNISRHQHNRSDVAPISQNDITPGNSTTGSITLATQTTYNIGVNFNPTSVFVHGNVVGASGERFITVGSAQFGPGFYLQPGTSTSVIIGGQPETIVQSCTYFGSAAGTFHTVADEQHIVDIFYSGTVFARATITGYSSAGIIVVVDTLTSGWSMNLNFMIT